MMACLRRWRPDWELVLVAARIYATLHLLAACQRWSVVAVARLRRDAALYAPPPPRSPSQKGRPRLKGARLPSLRQRLADPDTVWTPLRVRWHDGRRGVHVPRARPSGQPWSARRTPPLGAAAGPEGVRAPTVLLCTDPKRDPHTIVAWFLHRQVEVTFQAVRTYLVGETAVRCNPRLPSGTCNNHRSVPHRRPRLNRNRRR